MQDLTHRFKARFEKGKPLCLGCRRKGHHFKDCENPRDGVENSWFMDDHRDEALESDLFDKASRICARCQDLKIVEWLRSKPPYVELDQMAFPSLDDKRYFRSLGLARKVYLYSNCQVCQCLYAIIPSLRRKNDPVYLMLSWSIDRFVRHFHLSDKELRSSPRCVSAFLKRKEVYNSIYSHVLFGNAICLASSGSIDDSTICTAISKTSNVTDFDRIKKWIKTCEEGHSSLCNPPDMNEPLDILLLDVEERKLVSYSEKSSRYLALSYVWGGVKQASYPSIPGVVVGALPKTIEDAISVVKRLGERFLWVDSICIDQRNADVKRAQISRMASIYERACVTIVALSSSAADTGLSIDPQSVGAYLQQLSWVVGGRRLHTLGATKIGTIWSSTWNDRAWTLQEALLSQRRLYFSHHQVYFECDSITCAESLEISETYLEASISKISKQSNPQTSASDVVRVLRPEFYSVIPPGHSLRVKPLHQYYGLTAKYSGRSLSDDSDALNAFDAIMRRLESTFSLGGFIYGLPIAEIRHTLLWDVTSYVNERSGFPSWSWASASASDFYWPFYDSLQSCTEEMPVELSISMFDGPGARELFRQSSSKLMQNMNVGNTCSEPEISDLWRESTVFSTARTERMIRLEGIALDLSAIQLGFPKRVSKEVPLGYRLTAEVGTADIVVEVGSAQSVSYLQNECTTLLIMAGLRTGGKFEYLTMLLHTHEGVTRRRALVNLKCQDELNAADLKLLKARKIRVLVE